MRTRTPPSSSARKNSQNQAKTKRKPVTSKQGRSSVHKVKHIQDANPNATVRKRGNVYFLFHKERRRISIQLVFTIILAFVFGVGTAVSFATINNMDRQITTTQRALTTQQALNLSMRADTAERYTHDEIARRARALGLSEPDPSQIIYFYAPVYSQVYFRYNPTIDHENHFWQGIIAFLRGATDRILS